MEKKVFYISCKDFFFINLAEKLKLKKNWTPVYWTANIDLEKQVIKKFPDILFEKNIYRVRGYVPKKLKSSFEIFNSPIEKLALKKLREISSYMLERFNFNNSFAESEKNKIINHHIKYFDFITELKKPDIVIFQEIPHYVFDYILYEICKIKKIKTLMFAYSNFNGYSYIRKNIFSNPAELSKKNITLDENIKFQNDYNRIKNKSDLIPMAEKWVENKTKYVEREMSVINQIKKTFKNSKTFLIRVKKIFTKNDITSAGYIKLKNKSFLTFPTYLQQFLLIKKTEKISNNLKTKYRSLCKDPDLSKNYISFFLHYEPERATSPQCGLLYDQIENIKNISKLLPDNYYLYVKEHYKTFLTHTMMRRQFRKFDDYLKIIENKKVILVNDKYPSSKLIEKTKCVVTGVGTVASEALINLKPIMTYGYSWVNAFPYTLSMRTKFKLKDSLRQIFNNEISFKEKDVKDFLRKFSTINFKMQHTSLLREIDKNLLTEKENIDNIFEALNFVTSNVDNNKK